MGRNGASYIRKRQNERDKDRKRNGAMEKRRASEIGGVKELVIPGRVTSKRKKDRKKEEEIRDREQSCWSESRP